MWNMSPEDLLKTPSLERTVRSCCHYEVYQVRILEKYTRMNR